jgi:hypothetical protein
MNPRSLARWPLETQASTPFPFPSSQPVRQCRVDCSRPRQRDSILNSRAERPQVLIFSRIFRGSRAARRRSPHFEYRSRRVTSSSFPSHLVFHAESIEYGPDFHESRFNQTPYRHLRSAPLADVVPFVWRANRVLEGGPHVLPEADSLTEGAERSHNVQNSISGCQSKSPAALAAVSRFRRVIGARSSTHSTNLPNKS